MRFAAVIQCSKTVKQLMNSYLVKRVRNPLKASFACGYVDVNRCPVSHEGAFVPTAAVGFEVAIA